MVEWRGPSVAHLAILVPDCDHILEQIRSDGEWVGHGSWLMGRGSWNVGCGPWIVGRMSIGRW